MRIAILGPLLVEDDSGTSIDIPGARLRALLARLAVGTGTQVGTGALVDAVWGEELPADPGNALQALVSRLRRALGGGATVDQRGAGYRLAADRSDVDAGRFDQLLAAAAVARAAADRHHAADLLGDALALWRGPALSDVPALPGSALAGEARRLEDRRLDAVVDLAALQLGIGRAVDVSTLRAVADANPLHEQLQLQLIRALAADGRPGEALQAYERVRGRLADELGADPGPELQELYLGLLRNSGSQRRDRHTNLKTPITSFVGREEDVARIQASLAQHRLVTLVGPGGAGKTRLATEAAASLVDSTADGVWMAELAAVTSGNDVAQALLGSVGLREIQLLDQRRQLSGKDAATRLREGLADKQAVLVVDNCEHVIDAAAELVVSLLGECPGVRVLATSRESLGITGEQLLPVTPLGQPAADVSPGDALRYPAVQLFADRGAAVRADFAVDERSVGAVVEIVRRLDGLPLAIELAAARLRSLPVAEIAQRLTDRFRLLTGGSRTALPRHRTLRAVVDWSWELLTEQERSFAERLAVFPAGISPAAAAAVQPVPDARGSADDLLASLVDKSLLQPAGAGGRSRMLETIREYAAERLAERGELRDARARHAEYFADLLRQAEPHLTTREQVPWVELLTVERENILAALRFRLDEGDAERALEMVVALSTFTLLIGEDGESVDWLRDTLALPGGGNDEMRIVATALLALSTAASGRPATPETELARIAASLASVDIRRHPLLALLRPALAFFATDFDLAERYLQEAIAGGDDWARAAAYMFRANLAENLGDVESMRSDSLTALEQFRRLGERWGLASTLRGLAQIHALDGDIAAAIRANEEALALMDELGSRDDAVMIYAGLADLAMRRGETEAAHRYAEQAYRSAEAAGTPLEKLMAGVALANLEQQLGDLDAARRLCDDALAQLAARPPDSDFFGFTHIKAITLATAGQVRLADGRVGEAEALADEAFRVAAGVHDLPILATVGLLVVAVAATKGEHERAARMLGAAARLRGSADATSPTVAALTADLVQALGEAGFRQAYDGGREVVVDAATALLDPSAATV